MAEGQNRGARQLRRLHQQQLGSPQAGCLEGLQQSEKKNTIVAAIIMEQLLQSIFPAKWKGDRCAVEIELDCRQTGSPNHRAPKACPAASQAAIQAVRQVLGAQSAAG